MNTVMSAPLPSREPGERSEQLARASAARAQRERSTGLMLISLGAAIFLVPFVALVVLWLAGVNVNNVSGPAGVVLVPLSLVVITRGRRVLVSGGERVLAEDARPPIVYLRPFDVDAEEVPTSMWSSSRLRISPRESLEKTYEQRLARTLRKVGPLVAIGDPTERLPLLGAARVYARDDEWQETVDELIARASVLVMHTGESEGLAWEVRHVIALDVPEHVILALPLEGKRKDASRQERYDAFRRRFGDAFPQPLAASIGDCQFAYFDPDWTPRLLGARGGPLPTGDGVCADALRRLASEFKITWGPRWLRVLVYTAAVLAPAYGVVQLTGG